MIFIKEIEMLILQQVDHVIHGALAQPANRVGDWDDLLDQYNLARPRILDRTAKALELGLAKGLLPQEMCQALAGISDLATPAVNHVKKQFAKEIESDPAVAKRVALIQDYLVKLGRLRLSKVEAAGDLMRDPIWEEDTKPEFFRPSLAKQ